MDRERLSAKKIKMKLQGSRALTLKVNRLVAVLIFKVMSANQSVRTRISENQTSETDIGEDEYWRDETGSSKHSMLCAVEWVTNFKVIFV